MNFKIFVFEKISSYIRKP